MKAISSLDKLRMLLQKNNITYDIIYNEKPFYTVNDAKEYYKISQTAPVLVLSTDKGYFALIKAGDRKRIDFELIKKVLQCEKVKLASKKEVMEATGYEVGNVPLVGHGLPSILDTRLLLQSFIFGGTGDLNFTLKIDPRYIEKVNEIVAKID